MKNNMNENHNEDDNNKYNLDDLIEKKDNVIDNQLDIIKHIQQRQIEDMMDKTDKSSNTDNIINKDKDKDIRDTKENNNNIKDDEKVEGLVDEKNKDNNIDNNGDNNIEENNNIQEKVNEIESIVLESESENPSS